MEKILVVEDKQSIREEICDILQEEGFDVSEATNGFEGIKQTKAQMPDLIISDIKMPVLDGYQLVNEIKKYPETENIPIIFLSAKAQTNDIRKGMNLNVEDYIIKPINVNDLLNVVKTSLSKQKKSNKRINKFILSPIELLPDELSESINVVLGFSNYLRSKETDIPKDELELLVDGIYKHGEKLNSLVNDYLLYINLITKQSKNNFEINTLEHIHLYIESIVSSLAENFQRKNDICFDLHEGSIKFNDIYFQKIIEEIMHCAFRLRSSGTKIHLRSNIENNIYRLSVESEKNKNKKSNKITALPASCKKSFEIINLIAKNYSGNFKFTFNSDESFCFVYHFELHENAFKRAI